MATDHPEVTGPLFHLVADELWQQAKTTGSAYYPPTYQQDRFIHLTADPAFLLKVANHFYRDSPHAKWLLLVLDASKLTAKVIFEPAAAVGSKASDGLQATEQGQSPAPLFPHLYGTIDYPAVVAEVPIDRAADGTFLSIPGYVNST